MTTYKGHWNVWGDRGWVDFRTLTPELMAEAIRVARARGYLTSCNHPRPYGPPWEFAEVTGSHCLEVWNGPWAVFNSVSLAYYERRLNAGERLVAVDVALDAGTVRVSGCALHPDDDRRERAYHHRG